MGSKVTVKTVKRAVKAAPPVEEDVKPSPAVVAKEKPHEEAKVQAKEVLKPKTRACGCCPTELVPLPAGQIYFEAPDGHVIVGEHDRGQIKDRRLNNGRGGWINPMR